MKINDTKCTKSTCEKYTLRFNDGYDWAIFTIDNIGMFNCQSSFGNYAYHWSSFGSCFKSFLVKLDISYLLIKLCKRDYFDMDSHIKKCKKEIFRMRRESEITKDQAKEAFEFITEGLDSCGSYDVTVYAIYESSIINEISGDVCYSEFMPDKDYSPQQYAFVKSIYPEFVKILKAELNEKKTA